MYRTITTATAVFIFTTALATAQSTVFIPEGSTDTVRMVKAETGETIKRITGLEAVHGLSGSFGVPYLIAGSYAESDRASIALSTGDVTTAPLSPEPYHLTTIPGTCTFYVSSRAESKVWIIDEATLTPIGDFLIEGEGHQIVAVQ